jgi:hypothetical protein
MYIRELCSQTRVTIAAADILLDICEVYRVEDVGQVDAEVRIDASGEQKGEGGVFE